MSTGHWGSSGMAAGPEQGEFDGMKLEERLLRYHERSEEAFELAQRATNDAERESDIKVAMDWRTLALEAERILRVQRSGPLASP
jgi:hypothetical protein